MVNYKDGKIYKIVDNTNGNIYIGSTSEPRLCRRLQKHKSSYKCYLNPNVKQGYMRSFDIIKNNDYNIFLIENYPCDSKDELHSREQYYIDKLECINKANAYGINEENIKRLSKKHSKIRDRTTEQYKKSHKKANDKYRKSEKYKIMIKNLLIKNKEKNKKYKHNIHEYQKSWGGTITSYECNLLRIDINLFI